MEVKAKRRLVVSINLLQRSVSAEVDRQWVRPIACSGCLRWVPLVAAIRTNPVSNVYGSPPELAALFRFGACRRPIARAATRHSPCRQWQPGAKHSAAKRAAAKRQLTRSPFKLPTQQLPPDTIRPNYVLGPNDQILIRAPEAEEIDQKPFRIDGDGNINLPLVGRVHAAGMTLQELEADLVRRLREYIREPQVFVDVIQFRSAPIYFVGLFASPGIYPLQGSAL